jgi:hypothetical protein
LSLFAHGNARFRLRTPGQRPGGPKAIFYQLAIQEIKFLVLLATLITTVGFAQEWTKKSLGKDDTDGALAVLATARNVQGFKDWLNGKELNGAETRITVGSYVAGPQVTTEPQGNNLTLVKTVGTKLYILSERENGEIKRLLPVWETADSEYFLKRVVEDVEDPSTYEEKDPTKKTYNRVPREVVLYGPTKEFPDVRPPAIKFTYDKVEAAQARELFKTDPRVRALAELALNLWNSEDRCIKGVDTIPVGPNGKPVSAEIQLCKISPEATELIVAASRSLVTATAKGVASLADQIQPVVDGTSEYEFDDFSHKTVIYWTRTVERDGRNVVLVKDVEFNGFLRKKGDMASLDQLGPDAQSASYVFIDANGVASIKTRTQDAAPVVKAARDADVNSFRFTEEE